MVPSFRADGANRRIGEGVVSIARLWCRSFDFSETQAESIRRLDIVFHLRVQSMIFGQLGRQAAVKQATRRCDHERRRQELCTLALDARGALLHRMQ